MTKYQAYKIWYNYKKNNSISKRKQKIIKEKRLKKHFKKSIENHSTVLFIFNNVTIDPNEMN